MIAAVHTPLQSLLVKPAGPDCNMACDYCFYLSKKQLFKAQTSYRMSSDLLEILIKRAMAGSQEHINFGWQGGEPTLMGLSFFKQAVKLQRQYGRGHTVGNGLQTNGLLLDQDWIHFLKDYHFLVGLSLDGPQHVHDRYRHFKTGKGSWKIVRDRARLLIEAGVAVNALATVNDYSVHHIDETYDFLTGLGFAHLQFIPLLESDPAGKQAAHFSVTAADYGKFLRQLFDRWRADFVQGIPRISIRFFDDLFYHYVDQEPPACNLQQECGTYLVVEHNGDVYSCDFFVEPAWRLGNIREDCLLDLLNSDPQQRFGRRKAQLPQKCQTCQWYSYCRGGCPKDRLRDPRDQGENHFCQAYQQFFAHAHSFFQELSVKWRREQSKNAGAQSATSPSVGRNDPCPCGSGKKHKKCCGRK